ncbi:PREDICTED: RB1-inducible coiled-coil protein 1 isoform X1 [Polistes dominula]|uniref:RB1-inducible coiled-coil protein 1 isoform X1 n=1 Tax=Polistes dominula TaxID=743375 RepID=A0ABM1I2L2_POLDO|nr:PREDICTED: RB1-inducible coiled-coil protein 1 isoform X1 [Polistes dominula]
MLYVFHVDTGTTITFNINQTMETVSSLKEAIERECGVMACHQVLLMSGGDSLEPNALVGTYSVGTDTNPIYLFSKAMIESNVQPTPSIDYGCDVDLQQQIEVSMGMPPSQGTVTARAQLAQHCCALAREQTRICEKLVHDQHLQQQGWFAVVANLEDITKMFQTRAEILQQSFDVYLAERQQHMQLLNNFQQDLETLAKIPILPALRAHAEGLLSPEDQEDNLEQQLEKNEEVLSLLRWISAKDNQSSLEQVAEQCSRGLEQFDEKAMASLKAEITTAITNSNKTDMKEIKGLGQRLFALETLLTTARRCVVDQSELSQGFLQNEKRAKHIGDKSILPDLCRSHQNQLAVMLSNHNQIRDIRRKCTKAKEELSGNIHVRLKWVMYVENKMMEVDSKLVMYHESLKRLRRHLEVLQQIHLAPQMYINAVAEVVRRRTFSQSFLVWASNLACQLLTAHTEELARRREFHNKFEGHFLNTLFPGLDDTPPPFATEAPSVFDNALPKLTASDMESLRSQLPDIALSISMPDLNSITEFFLSKNLTEASTEGNQEKKIMSTRVEDSSKEQDRIRAPALGDRGGFESETDTEEFEKIGQGATDSKPSSFDGTQQKKQKQLEVGASRSVSPASSSSTNVSPLNTKIADLTSRLCTSNEPSSFHFPSLTVSERPTQLSPLTECAENGESSSSQLQSAAAANGYPKNPTITPSVSSDKTEASNSLSPNPPTLPSNSVVCDGQQQQLQSFSGSGASSPSIGVGATDFVGTEFYMDDSLPSSLSEPPVDGHPAVVSFLQESLGNAREEVERLRSILRSMKVVVNEALTSVREELTVLRNRSDFENSGITELTERIRQALTLYSNEYDHRLQEREQELTVSHELEMSDIKKIMHTQDEEIRIVKEKLFEKETEVAEQQHLISTMRQKMDTEQTDLRNLQSRYHQQMDETLEQARIDKETAVEKVNDEKYVKIASLTNSLNQCQKRIKELEDSLSSARVEQHRMVKEATEKLELEYKKELDSIRTRLKSTAGNTMERSPSDSSLEKIERPDFIKLVNHEAILAKAKEEMKLENTAAIRNAIEKERADCEAKLDHELLMARQVIEGRERELEFLRQKFTNLSDEYEWQKRTIKQLAKSKNVSRHALNEKVENLVEADKKSRDQKEKVVLLMDSSSHKEFDQDCLDMSQSNLGEAMKSLESDKDEAEASESKKVRLETDDDYSRLSRRLEILENDNKRLSTELKMIMESKIVSDAKIEALEADKVRLEIELVKERSRRDFAESSSSTSDIREKDMNTSVAIVSGSSSCRESTTSRDGLVPYFHLIQLCQKRNIPKLIQQRRITVTSCNPGDTVLVIYDPLHWSYALLQESSTLYFVNSDCLESLGWTVDGLPQVIEAIAEVINKEYCIARKSTNRYRVTQGTKFYQVRIKPVDETAEKSKSQMSKRGNAAE